MNKLLLLFTAACITLTVCSCNSEPRVKCENGTFVGMVEDNGTLAFKGIPYAKPPVGKLRWKAPQAAEPSDGVFEAKEFGNTAIQAYDPSEVASTYKRGEDCLTLNIWTKDLKTKKKPVLFWIHGGSYAYGGTVDPLYDGKFMAEAYPDLVIVTVNYRLNMMGFIDFSRVPGGEAFPDAPYLGILDQQQALRWVQQNIEGFGGDPNNVTIYGESAGGGSVSIHLVAKGSEGLFQRAIVMSGALNLTFSQKTFDKYDQTGALLKLSGSTNMDDLMAIPEDNLVKLLETDAGRTGSEGISTLAGLNNHPLRDDNKSIIPSDPFKALLDGASKDVDVIIGTTSEEMKYWAYLMYGMKSGGTNQAEIFERDTESKDPLGLFCLFLDEKEAAMRKVLEEDSSVVDKFISSIDLGDTAFKALYPKLWERTELQSEMFFRMGSILMAENHAKAGGKGRTYMYYFRKGFDSNDPELSWVGASHSCELTYAFSNIVYEENGTLDPELTRNFSGAIASFAHDGEPSQAGIPWTEYDETERNTMVVGKDCSMKMESDPRKDQREMLFTPFLKFWKNK